MFLWYLLLLVFFIIIAIKLVWEQVTSKYQFLYCPFNTSLIGSALHIQTKPEQLLNQFMRLTYKGNYNFLLWYGWRPFIISSTSEYVKSVLVNPKQLTKSSLGKIVEDWLGPSSLLNGGEQWKQRRNILNPVFHISKINPFATVFEKHVKDLVKKIEKNINEPIDVQATVTVSVLKGTCETLTGANVVSDKNLQKYVNAIRTFGKDIALRISLPWLWPPFIYKFTTYGKKFAENVKILHDFTSNVLKAHIDGIGEKKHTVLLDILLEAMKRGKLTRDEVQNEVDTFTFTSHDTTAIAINWCLYLIGRHPEHQRKLQKEIDDADETDISESIKHIKFLDCVLKESLRLYPPTPLIAKCLENDEIIEGETIYKGTDVGVFIFGIQRNENYWKDPLLFNPHRFEDPNILKENPYCYIPFAAGARSCIGKKYALIEAKIFLFHILKNFNLRSIHREDEIIMTLEMVTKSKNGLFIQFERR